MKVDTINCNDETCGATFPVAARIGTGTAYVDCCPACGSGKVTVEQDVELSRV